MCGFKIFDKFLIKELEILVLSVQLENGMVTNILKFSLTVSADGKVKYM